MTPYDMVAQENARLREKLEEATDYIAFLKRERGLEDREQDGFILQRALGLTPYQAVMLLSLYEACPRVVSKAGLDEAMHGPESGVDFKVVDVYICKLRRRLGATSISTVWGRGYSLADTGKEFVRKALAREPVDITPRPLYASRRRLSVEQAVQIINAPSRQHALKLGAELGLSRSGVDRIWYGRGYADARPVEAA